MDNYVVPEVVPSTAALDLDCENDHEYVKGDLNVYCTVCDMEIEQDLQRSDYEAKQVLNNIVSAVSEGKEIEYLGNIMMSGEDLQQEWPR